MNETTSLTVFRSIFADGTKAPIGWIRPTDENPDMLLCIPRSGRRSLRTTSISEAIRFVEEFGHPY